MIVNCFTQYQDGFVMLQKPRRGWWVLPGGKVDEDELWPEAAKREMLEEAGLHVEHLVLRGVYHLHIQAEDGQSDPMRRMIVQFSATHSGGILLDECKEGILGIIKPGQLASLPMNEGDRLMVQRTLDSVLQNHTGVSFGRFFYDKDHHLLDYQFG